LFSVGRKGKRKSGRPLWRVESHDERLCGSRIGGEGDRVVLIFPRKAEVVKEKGPDVYLFPAKITILGGMISTLKEGKRDV